MHRWHCFLDAYDDSIYIINEKRQKYAKIIFFSLEKYFYVKYIHYVNNVQKLKTGAAIMQFFQLLFNVITAFD